MLIKLLWLSALWLGTGLAVGVCLWIAMSVAKRLRARKPAPVHQVSEFLVEPTKQPFQALGRVGGPKPMALAPRPVDREVLEAVLVSVPGSSS